MKKIIWIFLISFLVWCTPLQKRIDSSWVQKEEQPFRFEAISEAFDESELMDHVIPSDTEFVDTEKWVLQVSGQLHTTKDFAHLNTQNISFRSYRPYQAPFTFVDTNQGWKPTIIENIHEVKEIRSNTGVSAFILSFEKEEQNPLSWSFNDKEDPLKMLYYQGKYYKLFHDFWLKEEANPKVWNGDLWHLEIQEHQDKIPEYLVMKNQEQIWSFFSLPGAWSMVKSFQVDDQWRWITYQKTEKLAGENNFKRKEAFELNGEDLLKTNKRRNSYGLNTINDQIFFFFKDQKGNIGYQLWNKRYPTEFEDIIDEGCCATPKVIVTSSGKIRFVAKKNGKLQEFEGILK